MTTKETATTRLNGWTRIGGVLEQVPVSKRTLLRWQAQGRIPVTKVGRVTLYRLSDIEKMLIKMTVKAIG